MEHYQFSERSLFHAQLWSGNNRPKTNGVVALVNGGLQQSRRLSVKKKKSSPSSATKLYKFKSRLCRSSAVHSSIRVRERGSKRAVPASTWKNSQVSVVIRLSIQIIHRLISFVHISSAIALENNPYNIINY